MKMCFILCDANAVSERAWVRDYSTKAISGMNGREKHKSEITNSVINEFCSVVGSSWLAVAPQLVSSLLSP